MAKGPNGEFVPDPPFHVRCTPEEHRELAAKGGRNSQRKRVLRAALEKVLERKLSIKHLSQIADDFGFDSKEDFKTYADALALRMIEMAVIKGDVKASEFIRDTIGEMPVKEVALNAQVENAEPLAARLAKAQQVFDLLPEQYRVAAIPAAAPAVAIDDLMTRGEVKRYEPVQDRPAADQHGDREDAVEHPRDADAADGIDYSCGKPIFAWNQPAEEPEPAAEPAPREEQPAERRRGRPPGAKNKKPSAKARREAEQADKPKRGRGRPPGAKNKNKRVS